MGRAIDMENDIQKLTTRVLKIEEILKEIADTVPKKSHVDLVEDVGTEAKDEGSFENIGSTMTGVNKDEKKKADTKGSNRSGVKSNKRRSSTKKTSDKS